MSEHAGVLIVEDDALQPITLCDSVRDLGLDVVGPESNLRDGLRTATDEDLDFALLDFDLGYGTDSLPIAEELTQRGIPFAFTTASDSLRIKGSNPMAIIVAKPIRSAPTSCTVGSTGNSPLSQTWYESSRQARWNPQLAKVDRELLGFCRNPRIPRALDWWQSFRERVETLLRQHELLVRATDVQRL
jgi:CheY-like chemotaxis protein